MDQKIAVLFMPDNIACTEEKTPLMLQPILFCPVLTWMCAELCGRGIERLFIVSDVSAQERMKPYLPKDADVTFVDGAKHAEELLKLLEGETGSILIVNGVVLPVVLVWYIFTELGSIAENAAEMGANVPEWLLKLLAAGKSAADKSAGGITVETGKNADGSPIGHLVATQLDELKMEDLEQLAIDMGLTVQDGAKRADLIAQISAEPVKVPNVRK